MNTPFTNVIHKQKGAALIVCLMLLTITTLVALNAVSSTVMEEKMSGNIRNKHLSFQAAEAGLREAEIQASTLLDTTTFDGTNGLFPRSEHGDVAGVAGAVATFPVWDSIADNEWVDGTAIANTESPPNFIIEDFGEAPRDNDCLLELPVKPGCMLTIYRVTSKATGLNSNSVTMIQSTYKRL